MYFSVFVIVFLNDDIIVIIKFKLLNNLFFIIINGKNYSDLDILEMFLNKFEIF